MTSSWLRACCLALAALGLTTGASARQLRQTGELWALLIAGSAGWGNYRHQADVAHAYQVLRRGGVRPERIVTMMADDLADNPANPHPGQLFNRPRGPDVYAGVPIDYRHDAVTAANFLAVLAGDASRVERSRSASGRVLASGPADKVFIYYSDHGAPGVVGMPSGPFLYADQLHAVVANKSRGGGFDEMVIYIEACESGSMFEGLLDDALGVYATTASNGHESSWGTYCPGMTPAPPPEFATCLGDLYSVAWLENADSQDLTLETLKKQFQLVKQRVSRNFTYSQGSHVMRFGALDIAEEPAAAFEGGGTAGAVVPTPLDPPPADLAGDNAAWAPAAGAVEQREADLAPLRAAVQRAAGPRERAAAEAELAAERSRRAALDAAVAGAVRLLLGRGAAPGVLRSAPGGGALGAGARPSDALVAAVVGSALPRPAGAPLVDDWDCLRAMVDAWEGACGPLDQYGMRHTRAFANLCNGGTRAGELRAAAGEACAPRSGAGLARRGADARLVADA